MAWLSDQSIPGQTSKARSAIASHDGLLHLVHLGNSSNNLWHSWWDGITWSPNVKIHDQSSKATPALASYNGVLHMVHIGDSSNDLWHSWWDGQKWTDNVKISGQKSKSAPVLATFGDVLCLLHAGDSSNDIWFSRWDGNSWTTNVKVPGQTSKRPCAAADFNGRLHMVHVGNSGSHLYHSWWNGTTWTDDKKIPGHASQDTPALVAHEGSLHLVHMGSNNHHLYHSTWDEVTWTGNIKIEGQLSKSGPSLANHDGKLHMVHAGNSSNNIWHSRCENTHSGVIMLTGMWPPTNEMLTQFSDDPELNPGGWKGQNWRGYGFDIYAFFPTFQRDINSDKGDGDFAIDYQDVSDDFERITDEKIPAAIVTFSKGFDSEWEIEYRQSNRSEWIPDWFDEPHQPTPAPPEKNAPPEAIRYSTLPVRAISDAINNSSIGISALIDNFDFTMVGGWVSEYIAYHGVWYQSLFAGIQSENRCFAAGHIHVNCNLQEGIEATELTLQVLLNHLEDRINGVAPMYLIDTARSETHSSLFHCELVDTTDPDQLKPSDNHPAGNAWCKHCFPELTNPEKVRLKLDERFRKSNQKALRQEIEKA